MSESKCPLCGHDVDSSDRTCSSCGVDLGLAARLSERPPVDGENDEENRPVSPEVLVPLLGERLIKQGVLTETELDDALEFQRKREEQGNPILIGKALVKLGMVDPETLDRTITQQIFQLQDALREANRDLELRVQERTSDLQKALERLSELNQLKSNFIANITHELRTPLTHIKGYTELLSDESLGKLSPEQAGALEVMERSIRDFEKLIDDLIRFSDAARGEISLRLSPFTLEYLFRYVTARAREQFGLDQVRLSVELPGDLPAVLGDFDKISWVVLHLIDNAVKFSEGRGEIILSAVCEDELVRVSIADSGIGIPDDKLGEIFEPFHQLDTSSTRRYSGTGLGLSLVRRILNSHQSDIRVKSRVGKGSTFYFTLQATSGKPVA